MASQDMKKRRGKTKPRKYGKDEPLPKGFEAETKRLEDEASYWYSTPFGYAKLTKDKKDMRLTSKEEVDRVRQRVKNRKAAIERAKKRGKKR